MKLIGSIGFQQIELVFVCQKKMHVRKVQKYETQLQETKNIPLSNRNNIKSKNCYFKYTPD